jgi:hypothetical protein
VPRFCTAILETAISAGIEPHHGAAEVIAVIGPKYAGTLNVDRGVEHRANVLRGTKFQRCMGHLTHNVKKELATKVGAARDFGEKMLSLKDKALHLHADWHAGRRDGYNEKVGRIEARFTDHLRDRRLTDRDNQRLLNGIGAEHDKGNLLRFLYDPRISTGAESARSGYCGSTPVSSGCRSKCS